MDSQEESFGGNGGLLVTGISRSGRVRKKSSKLLDFQSSNDVEIKMKRSIRLHGRSSVRGRTTISSLAESADKPNLKNELNRSIETYSGNISSEHEDCVRICHDSEDELDELVAGIVGGVEEGSRQNKNYFSRNKVTQSLYLTEKSNKRRIMKDGKVVSEKVERKDKGKSRFTAYSLWAREFRKTSKFSKNQDLDFSNAARRLGELWANVSNKEKNAWRRKAKLQASKAKSNGNIKITNSNVAPNLRYAVIGQTKKEIVDPQNVLSGVMKKNIETDCIRTHSKIGSCVDPRTSEHIDGLTTEVVAYQINMKENVNNYNNLYLPKMEAVDAAAHLKLLGESLTIIGERLTEHDGQIAVAGSLSVLLDSILCSVGSLLCLSTLIPGLEEKSELKENISATLDNIAYVMPGL